MWCADCGQDVPGIAEKQEQSRIVCARCGRELTSGVSEIDTDDSKIDIGAGSEESVAVTSAAASAKWDDDVYDLENWDVDENLRTASDTIRRYKSSGVGGHEVNGRQFRIDTSPNAPDEKSPQNAESLAASRPISQPSSSQTWLSWTLICLGMMTFTFGAVLAGWSLIMDRPDLWSLGLPTVLGGQAVLLLGLIFQLEGLWHTHRRTHRVLDDLDERMAELKRTTTLMATACNTPSQSFYTHMADGATPQMLLADLKGQLDLIALKMARD